MAAEFWNKIHPIARIKSFQLNLFVLDLLPNNVNIRKDIVPPAGTVNIPNTHFMYLFLRRNERKTDAKWKDRKGEQKKKEKWFSVWFLVSRFFSFSFHFQRESLITNWIAVVAHKITLVILLYLDFVEVFCRTRMALNVMLFQQFVQMQHQFIFFAVTKQFSCVLFTYLICKSNDSVVIVSTWQYCTNAQLPLIIPFPKHFNGCLYDFFFSFVRCQQHLHAWMEFSMSRMPLLDNENEHTLEIIRIIYSWLFHSYLIDILQGCGKHSDLLSYHKIPELFCKIILYIVTPISLKCRRWWQLESHLLRPISFITWKKWLRTKNDIHIYLYKWFAACERMCFESKLKGKWIAFEIAIFVDIRINVFWAYTAERRYWINMGFLD